MKKKRPYKHGPNTPYTRKQIALARETARWEALAGPVVITYKDNVPADVTPDSSQEV